MRPIRRMQVSTITVNPDHVQGQFYSNLVFVCVCVWNCFNSYEAAVGQLILFQFSTFVSMWRVKILSSPFTFVQLCGRNLFPALFLIVLREHFPFIFYLCYCFSWAFIGPAFVLLVRYHCSTGAFFDSPVFLFYHVHLQSYHTMFVSCFQYLSLCHFDFQGFCMSFIVSTMSMSYTSYDLIVSAKAFENNVVPPGDMNLMLQFGNIMQTTLPVFGALIMVCPGLFLSSFVLKIVLIDLVFNIQSVRDCMLQQGHQWFNGPSFVRPYITIVRENIELDPERYNVPVITKMILSRALREDLRDEIVKRLTFVSDEETYKPIVEAVGLFKTCKVFGLDKYVVQCGDDAWFTPVQAASECTVSELLLWLEEKDTDLLCLRHLIQRRFPGGYLREFDDLKDVLCTAREFATVPEILAVVTDEYLSDPRVMSDEELCAFLVSFLGWCPYEVRLNFLSLYSPVDPAVADILGCHFRVLDPVSQQLFAAEVFRMFTNYRPEWATSAVGSFQGVRLLEDQTPKEIAARIAGGET